MLGKQLAFVRFNPPQPVLDLAEIFHNAAQGHTRAEVLGAVCEMIITTLEDLPPDVCAVMIDEPLGVFLSEVYAACGATRDTIPITQGTAHES
jgi:hypothetical protein